MSANIFATTAPAYWERGLPVIPLAPISKIPVHQGWNRYAHQMVPPEVQADWLQRYANGNIGLPMGAQSGLIAVDVDTDDQAVADIIASILPQTPWVRRGKKGAVYIYRWNNHKTFRVRTVKGESLLEVLSSGTQIVLPPSIHPDTRQPYRANCELLDVLEQIPVLRADAEVVLRRALIEAGYDLSTKGYTKVTEVISVGARDSKMTSVAGIMAKGVTRGERTLKEAISEMVAWVENFTEKVAGDSLDAQKGVNKLVEFISKDIEIGGKQLPESWALGLSEEEKTKFAAIFGEENESWGLNRILDHLQRGFESLIDKGVSGMEERTQLVDYAIKKLAKNTALSPVEHDVVIEFISNATGKMVSKPSLRRRLVELLKGPIPGENHSEIARLLIEELGTYGEIRFQNGRFLQWKGSHWSVLDKSHIMATIASEFGNLPAARRWSDHEGAYRVMQSMVSSDFTMKGVRGLNFANGYLTTDLRLLEHNPEHGCQYVLPYSYDVDKAGHCQKFLSFLYQSWGHCPDYQEKVQSLRESLAITMFGLAPMFQKAFCLIGVPFSGKSVMMNIIQSMLPEESMCHVPPSKWADKFMPTMMDGKLANFCGELSESDVIPGDTFKSIVDGESLSGQFKGRDIFHFKPLCSHWFASNHLPRSRDSSLGFSRRWQFLHFDRAVPVEERVLGLANEIVAEEQEAIVAWVVQCVPDLLRNNNIVAPTSHLKLVEEMSGMNNSVRHFLRKGNVLFNPEREVTDMDLHLEYLVFCRENGTRPVSTSIFRQRLSEMETEFKIRVDDRGIRGLEITGRR